MDQHIDRPSLEEAETPLSKARLLLKTQPTAQLWEIELRRVLNGERESDLLRLGSVEEYVDKILDLSRDRAEAEQSFHEALRLIVKTWRPDKAEPKEYLACLIDLVGAYFTTFAPTKLLYFLDCLSDDDPALTASNGYGANADLYLSALVALERYFPFPVMRADDDWPAFQSYLTVLQSQLSRSKYSGYVAARLMHLGMVASSDERVRLVLAKNPRALHELTSLVFAPERKEWFRRDFGSLLAHSLSLGEPVFSVLEEVISDYGAKLGINDRDWIIEVDNEEIPLLSITSTSMSRAVFGQLRLHELPTLLVEVPKSLQARSAVAKILEQCVSAGDEEIVLFDQEMEKQGARIVYLEGEFKINVQGHHYLIALQQSVAAKYGCRIWSTGDQSETDLKEATLQMVEAKVAAAGAGSGNR